MKYALEASRLRSRLTVRSPETVVSFLSIELENRRLNILDFEALKGFADFDPAYPYLEKRRR